MRVALREAGRTASQWTNLLPNFFNTLLYKLHYFH